MLMLILIKFVANEIHAELLKPVRFTVCLLHCDVYTLAPCYVSLVC